MQLASEGECRDDHFLKRRLGAEVFSRRMFLQEKILIRKTVRRTSGRRRFFSKAFLLECVLRSVGLYHRGFRNYLDLRVVEHEVRLPTLPATFEGFRLMQLSDLHCTLTEGFLEALLSKLEGVVCDAVVFTGDYYSKIGGDQERTLHAMEKILEVLPVPRWGVLGNYEVLQAVKPLEDRGLRILLNEHDILERSGDPLFLCGVDDPNFFQTHDLRRARSGIPEGACTILLAHSPEVWREASALGYSLMLSGHTHGGQVCLPGGIPIFRKTCVPRALVRGEWRVGHLIGYTSPGTGASSLPVRFNCLGEITVHILRR